jgi:hypothetical protein
MRRFLKIFFVSLSSFLLLIFISVGILLWFVFTPEKLTPIVRKQSEKFIPYQTGIGEVELTLFSTFPHFGIKVNGFSVISPRSGASSDTLLKVNELIGVLDARAFWKSRELIIDKFILSDCYMIFFSDSLGRSNYGLLMSGAPSGQEESSEMELNFIELDNIEFRNLNISYTDLAAGLHTNINNLTSIIRGEIRDDILTGHLAVTNAMVSFLYEGEQYLDNARLHINVHAGIVLSGQQIMLKEAFASVNDLGIYLSGSIDYDTISKSIAPDIKFHLDSWQIKDAIALVPHAYMSGFGELDISGIVSSAGTVKGTMSDSLLPLLDINLILNDGHLKYEELPFPLNDINGEIHLYADIGRSAVSYADISHFEARTPYSEFMTSGKVSHLFDDIHYNLVTDASVLLGEFRSFIPEEMNLSLNGMVEGQLSADFTMSQAKDLELDKMKLAGSVVFSDFSVVFDSISMSTTHSKVDFSLPNPFPSDRNTGFAFAKIAATNLEASKIDYFSTNLKNTNFFIEMSDVRDTTLIPDLFWTFGIDSLRAVMDTISISLDNPYGYFTVSPVPDAPGQPAINLVYTSDKMSANMGSDFAVIGNMSISTNVVNDKGHDDFFLQWLINGFVEMNNGTISMSALSHSLEVPAIKMDFNPETFNIKESSIRIGNSDFGLSGILNNVLSYSKGDSILRGNFNFMSEVTDLDQLMNLTSGLGAGDETVSDNPSGQNCNNSSSGPYMVPLGIDMLLRANVRKATFGSDTITNIIGDVRISDGILVLDDLTFTTPAADMQLTAMYRTPRKNHLYLGLDYQMLDVEISSLLNMIPDIDTLLPMLRSFDGSGEFHIAIETYLDSLYNIKKSTLRGASSIRGEDLVLMDGETFSEIAKTLRFSKKAENRVDSLSAEFTIFREEIDIYPFLLVMDRYKAVVGGRHNLDMSFDYHISLVESPLPIRLGIDINGTMDALQYRIARSRYAEFYRPASRRAVESRQLELRRMIREALTGNISE